MEVDLKIVCQFRVEAGPYSQSQSEVEDVDIKEWGADADCELSEVFSDATLSRLHKPRLSAGRSTRRE